MYLSNNEISNEIEKMDIEVLNSDYPFSKEEQIQVCSIDLRLSNEFWKQKKVRYPIDLHKSKLAELSPDRHWNKIIISPDESITLKPNEFILGHTNEKFTIPIEYAGKINTRSSYARLGIETNSASDFINPGWRGYVPLEIINKSRNSIKIYPFISIAQLMLIPLSSVPNVAYGDEKSGNIYQNDDGGPSRYWRDKMFLKLQKNSKNLSNNVLSKLIERFSSLDDAGLYRFDKFFEKLQSYEIDNAENIINKFSEKEKNKSIIQNILTWLIPVIQTALIGLSIKLLLEKNYTCIYYMIWAITVLWFIPTIFYNFIRDKVKYYSNT